MVSSVKYTRGPCSQCWGTSEEAGRGGIQYRLLSTGRQGSWRKREAQGTDSSMRFCLWGKKKVQIGLEVSGWEAVSLSWTEGNNIHSAFRRINLCQCEGRKGDTMESNRCWFLSWELWWACLFHLVQTQRWFSVFCRGMRLRSWGFGLATERNQRSWLWQRKHLLGNKLPQNLVASNNKHFLSDSFCGSGIGEQQSWVVLSQGLSWGYC